ncbi:hypothetical protein [Streptomyces sp. NPDC014676]|uniref:hypothetical protein n=1 Tax=Streptomyces sp. NPDC014676 TaxID=3364879 RepID=UPI0036FDE555
MPTDVVIALDFAVVGRLTGACYRPPGRHAFDGLGYVLACLTAPPLAVRRRLPVPTVPASAAAYAARLGCGYQPSVSVWTPVVGRQVAVRLAHDTTSVAPTRRPARTWDTPATGCSPPYACG